MKTLLLVLLFTLNCIAASASHILGGYISAEHVNGRSYQIRAVLLSDITSPASSTTTSLTLIFGDGKTEVVNRTLTVTEDNVQLNVYTTEHLYATDGIYTIMYTSPNLPANIVNVNGGISEDIPFTTSCLIRINNSIPLKQSATPLAYEFLFGYINQPLKYNYTAVSGDETTIVHELVTENTAYTNYTLPHKSSINKYSGMLSFAPQFGGLYLFIIRASCYNNSILVSQSDMIQMVRVEDALDVVPAVTIDIPYNEENGWYPKVVSPNQSLTQQVNFYVGNQAPISTSTYSELFDKGAQKISSSPTSGNAQVQLTWDALPVYQRSTPYFVTYRCRTNTHFVYDYNLAIYHGAPINTGLDKTLSDNSQTGVYPNPVTSSQCTLVFPDNNEGKLNVFDCVGRLILTEDIKGTSHDMETMDWKPGMYTYSIVWHNGEQTGGKLIKP